jgi:hypothetical protein
MLDEKTKTPEVTVACQYTIKGTIKQKVIM